MKTSTARKGYIAIVAGAAMMIGSTVLTLVALPIMFPGLRARTFDNSAQEAASFLEQARTESVLRNAPVACRIETHGRKSVLVLDWNLAGPKVHPEGRRLELPRGVVVSQGGQPQTDGTVAIFNPRGGVKLGSAPRGPAAVGGVLTALNLSWPGTLPSDMRQISMVPGGTFQVEITSSENKNLQYAAVRKMEAK